MEALVFLPQYLGDRKRTHGRVRFWAWAMVAEDFYLIILLRNIIGKITEDILRTLLEKTEAEGVS